MSAGIIKPKEGYREFLATKDDKSTMLLSVRHPGKKEVEAADLEYSGTFNRMLMGGLPTQAKLLRELREQEVISLKDEEEIGQLAQDLRVLDEKLRKMDTNTDPDEKSQVQADRLAKNGRLGILNREISDMLSHTADSKASEAQRNFLIACVVEYAAGDSKGKRLYGDVDDLLSEQDGSLLNRILYEFMLCQQNLPSEWDTLLAPVKIDPVPEQSHALSHAVATAVDSVIPSIEDPVVSP